MKRFAVMPFICLMMLLVGCQPAMTVSDLIQGAVYHNDTIVLTSDDGTFLAQCFDHLYGAEPSPRTLSHDLIYRLDVQRRGGLDSYTLAFDLTEKQGVAMNPRGSYAIPFDWLATFLQAKPLPDFFPANIPPAMHLSINDHDMLYGYHQTWVTSPIDGVQWVDKAAKDYSDNYKGKDTDLTIHCDFGDQEPDSLSLTIIGTKSTRTYEEPDPAALPAPEGEGAYRYELVARWDKTDLGHSGTITYNFGVSIEKPTAYKVNKTSFEPGDAIMVLIENPVDLAYRVTTETYNRTVGLFYLGDDLVGMVPLDPRTEPGTYTLNFHRETTDELLAAYDYEVTEKDFNIQHLTVTGSTANLKSDENRAKDAEKFKNAKTHSAGEKLWEGPFLQPVEGRISTEYAEKRHVNGSPTSYRHSGIDIAVPTGTPVKADNHGIVTFASDLIIAGNTVVIDHGYGVFSSFLHLSEISVEEGQTVKKGDIIGAVGSTGYSTGPHLHWGIWKNGVWLNPWKFMEEDPLAVFETEKK